MKKINKIVIGSHNDKKIKEMNYFLKTTDINLVSVKNYSKIIPEENGKSFKQNALIKALHSFEVSNGKVSLADDSGLCIPSLNNMPGIFSARWANSENNYDGAFNKIKESLIKKNLNPDGQGAFFVCLLALIDQDKKQYFFEGRINGVLSFPPSGNNGFGYDPIFKPEGHKCSFANISQEKKNLISHRSKAFSKLIKSLN